MAMHTWFECKIRYEKTMENGMNKKVTEPYLVDALSFTEAEARIIEEMTPFISGEFTVSDIKRANYSELFPSEEEAADRWFKCKLVFITLDEKSGAEKKTSTQVLVQAADLRADEHAVLRQVHHHPQGIAALAGNDHVTPSGSFRRSRSPPGTCCGHTRCRGGHSSP